jgi:hypothetical protein
MIGLPIQVSHNPDPIDFVLNVVAAFYIVELDDLDGSRVIIFTGCPSCDRHHHSGRSENCSTSFNETTHSEPSTEKEQPTLSHEEQAKEILYEIPQDKLVKLANLLNDMDMTV